MNVKELRAALEDLPDDLMVVVRGYEGGVDEIKYVERIDVALNVNPQSYYGDHEPISTDRPLDEGEQIAPVVHLI